MTPTFSCVMPVKGARQFMDEAIASLQAQGMGDELEIIVQDGERESDAGLSDALNRGFAKARGEWRFWLNADDVLLPGALARVGKLIEKSANSASGCNWIAGNMVTLDAEGRIRRCLRDRGTKAAYVKRPIRVYGPSSFFRRGLFERAGGFDASLRYAMDSDLWLKFRENGEWFEKIPAYLFGFRIHADSITLSPIKSVDEQLRQDREVMWVRERHGVGLPTAAVYAAKLRRILDGSYLLGIRDTWRFNGKRWDELCQ